MPITPSHIAIGATLPTHLGTAAGRNAANRKRQFQQDPREVNGTGGRSLGVRIGSQPCSGTTGILTAKAMKKPASTDIPHHWTLAYSTALHSEGPNAGRIVVNKNQRQDGDHITRPLAWV